MDVATASGFAAMAAGGRKPGVGSVMGMMFGGGTDNQLARTIELRLGSNQPPPNQPARADHFFHPQATLGASLLLWSPDPGQPRPSESGDTPSTAGSHGNCAVSPCRRCMFTPQ